MSCRDVLMPVPCVIKQTSVHAFCLNFSKKVLEKESSNNHSWTEEFWQISEKQKDYGKGYMGTWLKTK